MDLHNFSEQHLPVFNHSYTVNNNNKFLGLNGISFCICGYIYIYIYNDIVLSIKRNIVKKNNNNNVITREK